jgi:hypothetical protein
MPVRFDDVTSCNTVSNVRHATDLKLICADVASPQLLEYRTLVILFAKHDEVIGETTPNRVDVLEDRKLVNVWDVVLLV